MTTPVVTVPTDAPQATVAAALREHRISGVPVVDATGAVVGLVSEYDLLARSGAAAGDVMSTAVISVTPATAATPTTSACVSWTRYLLSGPG